VGGELVITATSADPFQINVWSVLANGEDGGVANFVPTLNTYTWTIVSAAGGISGFAGDKFEVECVGEPDGHGGGNVGNSNPLVAGSEPHHGRPASLELTLPPLATVVLKPRR
jgi:hypothetical protein